MANKEDVLRECIEYCVLFAKEKDPDSVVDYLQTVEDENGYLLGAASIILVDFGYGAIGAKLLDSIVLENQSLHGNYYLASFLVLWNELSEEERENIATHKPSGEAGQRRVAFYDLLTIAIKNKASFDRAHIKTAEMCDDFQVRRGILLEGEKRFPRSNRIKAWLVTLCEHDSDAYQERLNRCQSILENTPTEYQSLVASAGIMNCYFERGDWCALHETLLNFRHLREQYQPLAYDTLLVISAFLGESDASLPPIDWDQLQEVDDLSAQIAYMLNQFQLSEKQDHEVLLSEFIVRTELHIGSGHPSFLQIFGSFPYHPIDLFEAISNHLIISYDLQNSDEATALSFYLDSQSETAVDMSLEGYKTCRDTFSNRWLYQSKLIAWVAEHYSEFENPLLVCIEHLWSAYQPYMHEEDDFYVSDPSDYADTSEVHCWLNDVLLWLVELPNDTRAVSFKDYCWNQFLSYYDDYLYETADKEVFLDFLVSIDPLAKDAGRSFRIAYLAAGVGRQMLVEPHYLKYLADNPDNASAHNNLAIFYKATENIEAAFAHICAATKSDPESELYSRNYESINAIYCKRLRISSFLNDNADSSDRPPVSIESLETRYLLGLTTILSGMQENYSKHLISVSESSGILFPHESMRDLFFDALLGKGILLVDRYSPDKTYDLTDTGIEYSIDSVRWVLNGISEDYPELPLYDACKAVLVKRMKDNLENTLWIWKDLLAHELFAYTYYRFEAFNWPLEYSHKSLDNMHAVLDRFSFRKSMAIVYGSVNRSFSYATEKNLNRKHAINLALKGVVTSVEKAVANGWNITPYDIKDQYVSIASEVFIKVLPEMRDVYYEETPLMARLVETESMSA